MKTLYFDDYEGLACDIDETLREECYKDEYSDVSVIAKYEDARQIINELIRIGYSVNSIDIHDADWEGYNDEYVISVSGIEEDELWCEPMARENGYLNNDSTVTYIFDDCSSKVISHCNSDVIYEVNVGEEPECDYECDCEKAENKPISTGSKEIFTVNGKRVDKDTYEKELAKFEDRYLDNIRDMLLRYADFMDDWNDMLKSLY